MAEKEPKSDRLDRELGELMQELRVLLPGVQVLFAFLLTVPFSQRFARISLSDKRLFVTALVCTALASALLIAPGAFHRVLFRSRDKEWLVSVSNRFALAGTGFLAVAMTCVVYLVVDVVHGSRTASLIAAPIGAIFVVVWYVVPLVRRARDSS
jgi:hypothetical protein